ncbi:MAG: hypothetical protein ACKVQJ_02935 [Pyrinomonadaceae bacterium]
MKKNQLFVKIIVISGLLALTFIVANGQPGKPAGDKRVKIFTDALELVSVTASADQCKDSKGISVRLRVLSDSAVDIRRYLGISNTWQPKDWLNQTKGAEIVDYVCKSGPTFKFYSRPGGSSQKFPKP